MSRPFDFGRVFFPLKKGQTIPDEIRFQPLGNHAANVRKLAWYWNPDDFVKGDKEASRKRVADAAYLHDIGKPEKFGVSVNVKANDKVEFSYSFRGHRFKASAPDQPWVEFLAKGHHDYSANDICRDTYKLKTLLNNLDSHHPLRFEAEKYKRILESEPLAYAHELYILEMCDQIEAEIACRFFEDDEQAESRAFMDFTITKDDRQQNTFFVDPWIFGDDRPDFKLTLAYWSMPFPQKLKEAIEKGLRDSSALTKQLQTAVINWWSSQPKNLESNTQQVIIKRLPKDKLEKLKTDELYTTIGQFSPKPMQETLAELLDREKNPHPAILLKAPTGSGKTESVLFPALANDYRLFLVLPARSLLEDQKGRIHKYLIEFSTLPQNQNREISLVVDTGTQMDRWIYKNGEFSKPKVNPRRHLYKGHIILTTLDKFLYRYFSFGDKQKSFIFPHRIHRQDSLFCFDEAHSYDDISFTNFQSLVQSLYEAGRSLVLMTATMPPELAKQFDYLETIDYTIEFSQQPERRFEWKEHLVCNREEPGDFRNHDSFQKHFTDIVVNEWKSRNQRSRIIAVAESVRDAAAIYQQIKAELRCDTTYQDRLLFLYHGRIAEQLRPKLYQAIKQRDDDKQPYIVVTTSAIEVGCDLNAEILVSQICPPENLIQRAGRCNRKGNIPDAKVIVVGDRIPEFANTLDNAGWHGYQKVLQSLTEFDAQEIGKCIRRAQHIDDYRVVELFSMLHDYVYEADLTCQPAYEKGLIPTRSWKPAVTLKFHGQPKNKNQDIEHSVFLEIDKLCSGEKYANTYAFEAHYDKENTRWDREHLLTWGSAYAKNITVRICPTKEGVVTGEVLPEYSYDEELGFVELPRVFTKRWVEGSEVKILYVESNHKAILTYVNSLQDS